MQGLLGLGPKAGACHGATHARQTPGRPESEHRWASQAALRVGVGVGKRSPTASLAEVSASEQRPAQGAGAGNFAQQAGAEGEGGQPWAGEPLLHVFHGGRQARV